MRRTIRLRTRSVELHTSHVEFVIDRIQRIEDCVSQAESNVLGYVVVKEPKTMILSV